MKTKFNSQICTTKEQSERLLALGLKNDTADMVYRSYGYIIDEWGNKERRFATPQVVNDWIGKYDIPAWSLDRLMELAPHKQGEYCDYANNYMYYYNIHLDLLEQFVGETKYEYLIDCIEWLIKEGYFNKEYLV